MPSVLRWCSMLLFSSSVVKLELVLFRTDDDDLVVLEAFGTDDDDDDDDDADDDAGVWFCGAVHAVHADLHVVQ